MERITGIDVIWFGHTPMPSPVKDGNTRWLDTSVFLEEGGLSIAELTTDGRVWHLRNADGKIVQGWHSTDR